MESKAKEKAIELIDLMYDVDVNQEEIMTGEFAKRCALICVNEIIAELDSERVFERIDFWNQVKQEIKKL
jgi:hypothetical protein